jgi:hypothetical protein
MNTRPSTLDRTPEGDSGRHVRTNPRAAALVAFLAGVALTIPAMLFFTGGVEVPTDTTVPPVSDVAFAEEAPANWDVLGGVDVRSEPGATSSVTGSLAADTVELESTGRIAISGQTLWREIKVPGATTGWVPASSLTETRPPSPGVDLGIPEAALETAEAIAAAAQVGDLNALAELALQGDMPFTASFGADVTTPAELVELWEQIGTQEVLDAIIGLVGLPDWYETAAQNADGEVVAIFVTPRFMHEPSNAENRRLVEGALGADYVDRAVADGQYLGWRLGITADGDWRFFVSGD